MSPAERPGTTGAILGFIGVASGAFGTHALRARLEPELLAVFETGARYLLVHAVVLVALEAQPASRRARAFAIAANCFAAGCVVFSGSLFALALTGGRVWGAVTPLGGALLLAGWLSLAVALARREGAAGR